MGSGREKRLSPASCYWLAEADKLSRCCPDVLENGSAGENTRKNDGNQRASEAGLPVAEDSTVSTKKGPQSSGLDSSPRAQP